MILMLSVCLLLPSVVTASTLIDPVTPDNQHGLDFTIKSQEYEQGKHTVNMVFSRTGKLKDLFEVSLDARDGTGLLFHIKAQTRARGHTLVVEFHISEELMQRTVVLLNTTKPKGKAATRIAPVRQYGIDLAAYVQRKR
ncbi:hypothetical protein ACFL6C_01155 [Myxococcota bacterium]